MKLFFFVFLLFFFIQAIVHGKGNSTADEGLKKAKLALAKELKALTHDKEKSAADDALKNAILAFIKQQKAIVHGKGKSAANEALKNATLALTKEQKARIEDALHATKGAVDQGNINKCENTCIEIIKSQTPCKALCKFNRKGLESVREKKKLN